VSEEAGSSEAMVRFYQGRLRIYEINKTWTNAGFSGRREGPFEIWHDEYRADYPEEWKFSRRIFWEKHNKMMHYMQEHPDRFRAGVAAMGTNDISSGAR
jgi:hypothetical protein